MVVSIFSSPRYSWVFSYGSAAEHATQVSNQAVPHAAHTRKVVSFRLGFLARLVLPEDVKSRARLLGSQLAFRSKSFSRPPLPFTDA